MVVWSLRPPPLGSMRRMVTRACAAMPLCLEPYVVGTGTSYTSEPRTSSPLEMFWHVAKTLNQSSVYRSPYRILNLSGREATQWHTHGRTSVGTLPHHLLG